MRQLTGCALAIFLTVFAGCGLGGGRAPSAPPAPAGGVADAAVFRPGDTFEMSLSGMPPDDAAQFRNQYTVGTDGFVNMPFVKQVKAAGLTQSQLERAIEERLAAGGIFTSATVTINVAPQARFVTIGGQVRAPQRMAWTADMTLLSGLVAAGGAGDFGGDKVRLTRGGKVTIFSRKRLNANPADDPRLLPGDQVELL